MLKHTTWTPEEIEHLEKLRGSGTHAEIAEKMSEEFKMYFSSDAVRKRLKLIE